MSNLNLLQFSDEWPELYKCSDQDKNATEKTGVTRSHDAQIKQFMKNHMVHTYATKANHQQERRNVYVDGGVQLLGW